ncbi:hypothetical protein ACNI3K_00440 [Demequina sp. SO4-13]|uniref:hypothetical protein n=1 Tax=Demequina sp. SO4-13 TaxID=3401027 RepID=UPI003AF7C7F3
MIMADGDGIGSRSGRSRDSLVRKVLAVAAAFGLLMTSGCGQNARADAEDRGLNDAAHGYAESLWCLESVAEGEYDLGLRDVFTVDCFDGDFREVEVHDMPILSRGSYLVPISDGQGADQLQVISHGFAKSNHGGGSSSFGAVACWSISFNEDEAAIGEPVGFDCGQDLLLRMSSGAEDVGLDTLSARMPDRDEQQ